MEDTQRRLASPWHDWFVFRNDDVPCDWEHVEKDGACGEIGNRQLTLSYGPGGAQTVVETVENWRNVAPCGN